MCALIDLLPDVNHEPDLSDFDYDLPEALIAQTPASERTASRLLHLDASGALHDRLFPDLFSLLLPDDLLVFNNTRVIKARLLGHKATGGKVEVLVERLTGVHDALAHIRSSRAPRAGTKLNFGDGAHAHVKGRQGELFELSFDDPVMTILDSHGSTPLPPYISRQAGQTDDERYQTVYAQQPGAVAAPTAGLHFDEAMLHSLDEKGIARAFVTLHVGAGTFQPVRSGRIHEHIMHEEWYVVPGDTIERIHETRKRGGRVIAIGTTSARALESAAAKASTMNATPQAAQDISGDTRLFITPGYTFRWVDALLTNFHLPQSTLLMMVSALAGIEPIQRAYAHAVHHAYRFFSYGDAMFIEPPSSD